MGYLMVVNNIVYNGEYYKFLSTISYSYWITYETLLTPENINSTDSENKIQPAVVLVRVDTSTPTRFLWNTEEQYGPGYNYWNEGMDGNPMLNCWRQLSWEARGCSSFLNKRCLWLIASYRRRDWRVRISRENNDWWKIIHRQNSVEESWGRWRN